MADAELWQKRLAREKAARQEAEQLLEQKSAELFQTNQNLAAASARLEGEVEARTQDLSKAVEKLEREILRREDVERQLRVSRDDAVQTADLKSQFLARMSHEIRTPLNAIIGLTDVLLGSKLSTEQLKHLNIVKSSGKLLLKIVNDILDLSKLDANKILLEYQAISLTQLLDQSVALVANSAAEKNLKIRIYLDQNTPDTIIADKMRLQQILLNLLSNAVKYSDSGTIKVLASIERMNQDIQTLPAEIRALQAEQEVNSHRLQIAVEDQGLGIAIEDQKIIFDSFSQLQGGRLGSTGLGLSICSRLTRLMGGDIEVESAVGSGSRFTVSLPCLLASESKLAATGTSYFPQGSSDSGRFSVSAGPGAMVSSVTAAVPLSSLGREKPLSILVADDNEVNRIVHQVQLEELGYRADLVTNGEEVLRALNARHYDLLLLDILMPVLDGVETTHRIRQLETNRQPYIIAVTASALPEDRQRFRDAGINDHLAKPVTLEALAARLETAFDQVKGQAGSARAVSEMQRAESDVLRLDDLRSRLGSTANELLRRVIPVFVREMPGRARALRQAHSNMDPVSFARLCHSLKGSCRSVGAEPLAEQCETLEQRSYISELPSSDELESLLSLSDDTVRALSNELKALESR